MAQKQNANLSKKVKQAENYNQKIQNLKSNNPLQFSENFLQEEKQKSVPELKPNGITAFKEGELEGYLSIPCINLVLPIYEGTEDYTLYKGIGHHSDTSLPTGGKGNHCVLTGHSGLATSIMFTNLNQMTLGDKFYITCLNKKLEYQVDRILVVKPSEINENIELEKENDYCTLVTCTPIIINTNRLLVRGKRIKYDKQDILTTERKEALYNNAPYIAGACMTLILIAFLMSYAIKKRAFHRKTEGKE